MLSTISFLMVSARRDSVKQEEYQRPYGIISQAPKKYQKMLTAFRFADADHEDIKRYCQPRLRIVDYGLVRSHDKGYSQIKPVNGTRFKNAVRFINRDDLNPKVQKEIYRAFDDFQEGLLGVRCENASDHWIPESGDQDFITMNTGRGYIVRPCAGFFMKLLIDPKNSRRPILGWVNTVR